MFGFIVLVIVVFASYKYGYHKGVKSTNTGYEYNLRAGSFPEDEGHLSPNVYRSFGSS